VQKQEHTRQLVQHLLRSQRFAVLSTESETGPYASLIAFWAADDLTHVVFSTMRATRKFNYLVTHPRVALLFDNRSNRDVDVREAMAVTATGTARELSEEGARAAASDAYLAKHPHLATFVASPGCAFVRVAVDTYYVVTHFQSVVELHMPRTEHAG
jgi:nitroimidazol reductase NimA-like FMN-containing flavoprotein (pyridoxamine 5'-phosphate oxidase superfamily)